MRCNARRRRWSVRSLSTESQQSPRPSLSGRRRRRGRENMLTKHYPEKQPESGECGACSIQQSTSHKKISPRSFLSLLYYWINLTKSISEIRFPSMVKFVCTQPSTLPPLFHSACHESLSIFAPISPFFPATTKREKHREREGSGGESNPKIIPD